MSEDIMISVENVDGTMANELCDKNGWSYAAKLKE